MGNANTTMLPPPPVVSYSDSSGIPAVLLEPQECQPDRCRFPGTALPPPSPIILAALDKAFFAQLRREVEGFGFDYIAQDRLDSNVIHSRILELARGGLSPDQIRLRIDSPEERIKLRGLLRAGIDGATGGQGLFGSANLVRFRILQGTLSMSARNIELKLLHTVNLREVKQVVRSGDLCLHDLLDPVNIEEWTAFLDVHQQFPVLQHDDKPRVFTDREPLFIVLRDMLERRELDQGKWGSALGWRMKVKEASDRCNRILGELASETLSGEELWATTRTALEQMGSTLPLFNRTMLRRPKHLTNWQKDPPTSALLLKFIHFASAIHCEAELKTTKTGINAPIRIPIRPLDALLPPSSPLAPDTTFRRMKMVKNDSEIYWFFPKRVEPRCCAPDRCSGRTPATINDPSAPDYARVESSITSIFLDCFLLRHFELYDPSQHIPAVIAATFGQQLGALRYDTNPERWKSLAAFQQFHRNYIDSSDTQTEVGFLVIESAYQLMYNKIESAYRQATGENRFPCLCDLVNTVDSFENLACDMSRLAQTASTKPKAIRPSDMRVVPFIVTRAVEKGLFKGKYWKGGSWKRDLDPFVRFLEGKLDPVVSAPGYRESLVERYRQLFVTIGPARLLEECIEASIPGQPTNSTIHHLASTVMTSYTANFKQVGRSSGAVVHGNEAVEIGDFEMALDRYRNHIVMSHVGSWGSRVNSAAVRLRLANSGSQHHQYSMAIQDCTMALYYCPPKFKFKAYYRRGFALARLQLWKKAILDFEQALLIEPKNPLILQELAAAKRMLEQ